MLDRWQLNRSDAVSKSVDIEVSVFQADAEHLIKLNICCHCRCPGVTKLELHSVSQVEICCC